MDNNKKIELMKKILAWIGLIVITIVLCIIAYALLTSNGKLATAMLFALVFISIIFWVGIKLTKDAEAYREALNKSEREKEMYKLSHQNTKNI